MGWVSRSTHVQKSCHIWVLCKYKVQLLTCDGCMTASCMPRNFRCDQLVGIVCPGISWVVHVKAISFGRIKVLKLKLPGRCDIPG